MCLPEFIFTNPFESSEDSADNLPVRLISPVEFSAEIVMFPSVAVTFFNITSPLVVFVILIFPAVAVISPALCFTPVCAFKLMSFDALTLLFKIIFLELSILIDPLSVCNALLVVICPLVPVEDRFISPAETMFPKVIFLFTLLILISPFDAEAVTVPAAATSKLLGASPDPVDEPIFPFCALRFILFVALIARSIASSCIMLSIALITTFCPVIVFVALTEPVVPVVFMFTSLLAVITPVLISISGLSR